MNIVLETVLEDERWNESVPNVSSVAGDVKDAVFSYIFEYEKLPILTTEQVVRVNLCLSDDAHVHQLNRDFRNIDKPTNVLSFANLDSNGFMGESELFGEVELGDIIIAYETMQREAEAEKITLHDHFCHLLTHGFLHLLGYDHIDSEEAVYMENLEKTILRNLNIANPYADED